ncbi:MAG: flagellar basal body rod protein FlgC [Methylophilaceae bacterium]|jgi:flagellar basal-body rod protein FlgC|uniref:flagellar basal body rod protein FlgC n=1 Tax=Methylobacillus sp. MM3 TaxID=1848039 RepID=UPI0007E12A1E|nr:flagellar basal body rod protein FlgC [Methylobacillus sp. MM3]OAJ71027.1 flagellar basal body rod protein FlgC [Methylobacillus sp. MM3]
MALFNVFDIAGSAMTAQSMRLNVVASNMANADSVTGADGQPYRAKQVIFQAQAVNNAMPKGVSGVAVTKVIDDPAPMKLVYDPQNPFANAEGYVTMPNVNVVEEMTNMISASRSYQANVEMMNTAKTMIQRTLTLGQ